MRELRQARYTLHMAVYTELTQEQIESHLATYDLPQLRAAEGIRAGVENTNYALTLKDGSKFILTLFEKRVAEKDLPFFASLMERLAERQVPCPKPIHATSGDIIQRLRDRPALIVTFLEGKGALSIQNMHMSELGAYMARMHLAAEGFEHSRVNALSLSGWKQLVAKIAPRADDIAPGLTMEIQSEIKAIEAAWPSHLPRGVIHGDLFPDNVFFDNEDKLTGIIDFYFACNDFLVYDLAICLNAWCFEKTLEFNITRAKLMLTAYNAVRPISDAELEALPILARGAALRFLLTRAHDSLFPVEGALVTPKDPIEYLKKLRFHRSVQHHKEYGL